MKKSFLGYYRLSEQEFSTLWNNGVFVLDANVILNLYRYSKETRDDLMKILETLSDRLWLPHQAALEYQENRLNVIAEQVKRYREVRDIILTTQKSLKGKLDQLQLKKRHTFIDPDRLLEGLDRIFGEFLDELKTLEDRQPDVFTHDELRDRIDQIFMGKVGVPPDSQEWLEEIYREGKTRFRHKRPPGYMDAAKESEEGEEETYTYGGLLYKREYGDLILWRQIITEAKEREDLKHIILITDDNKEDWWWKADSKGDKTIGPRPELIEEISSEAKVSLFYMYDSLSFMSLAEQYLGVQVRKESIAQVRDIAQANARERQASFIQFGRASEQAVLEWLKISYPDDEIFVNERGFPDIIRIDRRASIRIGYDVKFYRHRFLSPRLRDALYRGYYEVGEGDLDQLKIVVVTDERDKVDESIRLLKSPRFNIPSNTSIIVGLLMPSDDKEGVFEFKPLDELT